MAGPAMIEGGGLGKFAPEEIGPIQNHRPNGVVDVVVEDEAEATKLAKKLLSYFQGSEKAFEFNDQKMLRNALPDDRRYTYEIREILKLIADKESLIEIKKDYGRAIVNGFIRIEGHATAFIASDCKHLGGAVDSESADKASDFFDLCSDKNMPIVSFVDTPGFMVGPDLSLIHI